ncbi:MAG: hypothetical protein LBS81_00675 [Endomicrobium sp.]|nr:hypothetical protein [Endomicrobium sp.]
MTYCILCRSGHISKIKDKIELKYIRRYIFTHQDGRDVQLYTNKFSRDDIIKFVDTTSQRARIGVDCL